MRGTPDGWQVFKYALLLVLALLVCITVIYLGAAVVASSPP